MSRLEELIQELCPNGVKFLPISEIGTLTRGKRFVHADAVDEGVPCIHYGEIYTYYGLSTVATKSFVREEIAPKLRYAHKNDVIIVGAGENNIDIGIGVAYLGDDEVAIHDACYILTHEMNPKYISYCLRTNDYHKQIKKYVSSGKICSISAKGIGRAVIPVPPLEVQREIVRILDHFTELTTELTTELAARKKQYEYYRDQLLNKKRDSVEWVSLSDLGKWSGGKTPSMAKTNYWDKGKIPWISSKDMKASTLVDTQDHITEQAIKEASMTISPKNCIAIVTRSGILKHTFPVAYVPFETTVNQDIKILSTNSNVLPRYAFHVIQGNSKGILNKTKKQGGTVDSLEFQKVLNYKVPLPSLEEQQRIVDILDRFDTLCNDLTAGLPAEIEARQKQYEYYRDKLLTFEPLAD